MVCPSRLCSTCVFPWCRSWNFADVEELWTLAGKWRASLEANLALEVPHILTGLSGNSFRVWVENHDKPAPPSDWTLALTNWGDIGVAETYSRPGVSLRACVVGRQRLVPAGSVWPLLAVFMISCGLCATIV